MLFYNFDKIVSFYVSVNAILNGFIQVFPPALKLLIPEPADLVKEGVVIVGDQVITPFIQFCCNVPFTVWQAEPIHIIPP